MLNHLNTNLTTNSVSSTKKTLFTGIKSRWRFGRATKAATWYSFVLDTNSKVLHVHLQGKIDRKQLLGLEPLIEYHARQARYTRVSVGEVKNLKMATLALLATLCSKLEHKGFNVIVCGVPTALYLGGVKANLHQIATFE